MRRTAVLVALLTASCHAYQRDPGYARARLSELVHDPFRPDNAKYTFALACIGAVALLVVVATTVWALRARKHTREP